MFKYNSNKRVRSGKREAGSQVVEREKDGEKENQRQL